MTKKEINCSRIFILPVLKIDREKLKELGLINTYLDDMTFEIHYENALYVLFKPDKVDKMYEFIASEGERTANLIDDYDYEGGYVVVVYLIPKEFQEDIPTFLEGKYSELSEAFKEAIPKVTKIITQSGLHRDELTLAWRIFKKDNELKERWEKELGVVFTPDMEVWSKPDLQKEVLDIEEIRKTSEDDNK